MPSTVSVRITTPQFIPPPEPSPVPLWQFKQSHRPLESAQTLGSAPDVVVLATGLGRFTVTKEWQLYIRRINYNMQQKNVWGLFGKQKAFCNADADPRQNWIEGKDLGATAKPQFDKDRTCGLACHTGVEEFSALQAIKNFGTLVKQTFTLKHSFVSFKSSFRALADNNVLRVTMFDGRYSPPPLSEINPRTHPWFYFHATIIYRDGKVAPFPAAAPAPEWGYTRNVVLMPLVAIHPILYPLHLTTRVNSYRLPYSV